MNPTSHDDRTAESGQTRRRFVALVGTTGAVALAGCADGGDEAPEEEPGAGTETPGGMDGEETETPGGMDGEETETEGEETPAEGGDTYELRVTVEDSAGEVVEGATVDVVDTNGESVLDEPVETNADGVATAEVRDGEYTVRVQADGYAEAEEPVTVAGEAEEVTVTLEEGTGTENGTATETDTPTESGG